MTMTATQQITPVGFQFAGKVQDVDLERTFAQGVADATWITTISGKRWQLLDPNPDLVDFYDIAEALSKIPRFVGHTPGLVYSVAQHCCIVCDNAPLDAKPWALLHDAAEAYLNDISKPLKNAMRILCNPGADPYSIIEERTDRAILKAAGLEAMEGRVRQAVKDGDRRAYATEVRDLCPEGPDRPDVAGIDPYPKPITPWPWPRAADEFLARCWHLVPGAQHLRS